MRPGKLFLFAVLIRLLFLILALLADNLAPDYDNSMMAEHFTASAENKNNNNNNNNQDVHLGRRVFSLLDPLMRWDAVHFRHIAKFGYTHEHLCAFFPQTPHLFKMFGLVSTASLPLETKNRNNNNDDGNAQQPNPFFETKTPPSIFLNEISFLAFHIFCFAFATLFLRSILLSLTDRVNNGDRENNNLSQTGLMRPSLLVWLINPASIFFTAAYTETYFSLIAFAGMFCIERLHFYSGFRSYNEIKNISIVDDLAEDQDRDDDTYNNNDDASSSNILPIRLSEKELSFSNENTDESSSMKNSYKEKRKHKILFEENLSNSNNNSKSKSIAPVPKVVFHYALFWAFAAAACFYVATTFRSNGILLGGFLIHFAIARLWANDVVFFIHEKIFSNGRKSNEVVAKNNNNSSSSLSFVQKIFLTLVCVGLSYLVTLPYQNHINMCHRTFCQENDEFHKVTKIPRDTSLVCNPERGVSGFYAGIQLKYWKVGLFEYWTPNNIPNFLIALPTFLFVAVGLYFRIFLEKNQPSGKNNNNNSDGKNATAKKSSSLTFLLIFAKRSISWLSTLEACHIVYLLAQLVFALLTMNVQVVTRFVAASPALYYLYGELLWKCTVLTESTGKLIEPYVFADSQQSSNNNQKRIVILKRVAKILKPVCCGFVLVWAAVGTAMFPNFMPWT